MDHGAVLKARMVVELGMGGKLSCNVLCDGWVTNEGVLGESRMLAKCRLEKQ